MAAEAFIQCRVTVETKEKVRTLAARQQLSESALLQRLIDLMLQTAGVGTQEPIDDDIKSPRDARITIRLRGEDQALLHARAAARGMPSATYVSVLTRAHLRNLMPLPKEELLALKRTVSELGRIGRLLNPIARSAHQGDRVSGPGREDLRALLRVCEGLRDHVKNLLRVNLASWKQGYSETDDE
jgi:predicted DNA binding CopG/RHH family protein